MSGVQGGRNSGSQHGRSNHEHERSSLSSAVAKEVAKGVVHVGQRQEHVKRGNQNAGTSAAAANENHGAPRAGECREQQRGQDGAQHVAARRQRSAGQDVQARQGFQRALGAKVPT